MFRPIQIRDFLLQMAAHTLRRGSLEGATLGGAGRRSTLRRANEQPNGPGRARLSGARPQQPHSRENARRGRQIAAGILKAENGVAP